MSLRTGLGLLVVTLGVGVSGVAAAQEAPQKKPSSGSEQVGQTAPPTAFAESIDTEEGDSDKAAPPRVPWRGTNVSWTNTATTSVLGIGQEVQSTDYEQYIMNWAFHLNYFLVDQDKWSIGISTTPGFSVELTNSDITTTQREVQFNDLPLIGAYNRNLYSHEDGWNTGITVGSGFIFPTSPISYNTGRILTTTQRVGVAQVFPLAGPDSPVFKTFSLSGSLRWDHNFTEATTAVSPQLERERQSASGAPIIDDQLTGGTMIHDTLRESITLSFTESIPPGMPISLSGTFYAAQSFKYAPTESDCVVVVNAGDTCIGTDELAGVDEPNQDPNTIGFGIGLSFQPIPEASVSFDYDSGTPQLGPDGLRRSVFYNPYATFSGTLTFHPDALYERFTGPKRAIAENDDERSAF